MESSIVKLEQEKKSHIDKIKDLETKHQGIQEKTKDFEKIQKENEALKARLTETQTIVTKKEEAQAKLNGDLQNYEKKFLELKVITKTIFYRISKPKMRN